MRGQAGVGMGRRRQPAGRGAQAAGSLPVLGCTVQAEDWSRRSGLLLQVATGS